MALTNRFHFGAYDMTSPVLIELTRGKLVESIHAGSLAVARPNGELLIALGDVARPVFPRSAIKSLQALPLLETGAADAFGFGPGEIALACASHSGTERHTALAASMLARAGLRPDALGCGAHMPGHEPTARAMTRADAAPTALHNNCSGKHAGMLVTAAHLGEPAADYWRPEHPVQQRILRTLREVTGLGLDAEVRGVDGCSVPNWAMPLAGLATAFARLGTGDGLTPARSEAARRIMAACWAEPELVSGPGRLDAHIMGRLGGRLFTKTGAEGVYCASLPGRGLGIALKAEDGNPRASHAAMAAIACRLFPELPAPPALAPLRNWRGIEVGAVRVGADLARALDRLAA